jgi:hypothetical protein
MHRTSASLITAAGIAISPAVADAAESRVVLENDQLRVVEYVAQPGQDVCGEGVHSHPAHLTVIVDQAKVVETVDGQSTELEPPKGFAFWSGPVTHTVKNVGNATSRALLIETK